MLKKLLSGRKKVIDVLNGFSTSPKTNNGGSNSYTMHQQVKRRYFQELSDIKNLVGDDSEESSDSNYQGFKSFILFVDKFLTIVNFSNI